VEKQADPMAPPEKSLSARGSRLNKISFVFIFFAGVMMGIGGGWLAIQNNTELRYYLLEQADVNLPQAQITVFVRSIVRGDRAAALKLWEAHDDPSSAKQTALMQRREAVISELLSAGIDLEYMVLDVEWWTTCCEPGVTNQSRNAGGARIRVQFIDQQGSPISYMFDVFTREQPYWGGAMGYPPRTWVIRDVYPYDQDPLYWPLIHEAQIRSVQPPEP
jgi:hypothetical protein